MSIFEQSTYVTPPLVRGYLCEFQHILHNTAETNVANQFLITEIVERTSKNTCL